MSRSYKDSMKTRAVFFFVATLVALGSARAQEAGEPPCAAPEFRQFDFWVGAWELSWPASETSEGKPGRGTNRIEIAYDQCVIVEHFDGRPGMTLQGTSVSTFNREKHQWQQTWVDNSGSYLDFTGEFKNGQMVLVREAVTREGKKVLQRMVWKNITADSLDWSWERSMDGGRTWKVAWPIHYQRTKASMTPPAPLSQGRPNGGPRGPYEPR